MADTATIFTKTSAFSLAGVLAVGVIAYVGSKVFLPKNARWQDRYTFIWLVSSFFKFVANVPTLANLLCFYPWLRDTYTLKSLLIQAFDALIHFVFEGSFLWLSVFGRQVNISTGPFAEMCTSQTPTLPTPPTKSRVFV